MESESFKEELPEIVVFLQHFDVIVKTLNVSFTSLLNQLWTNKFINKNAYGIYLSKTKCSNYYDMTTEILFYYVVVQISLEPSRFKIFLGLLREEFGQDSLVGTIKGNLREINDNYAVVCENRRFLIATFESSISKVPGQLREKDLIEEETVLAANKSGDKSNRELATMLVDGIENTVLVDSQKFPILLKYLDEKFESISAKVIESDTVTSERNPARSWERREGNGLQRVQDEGTDEVSDDLVTTLDPKVEVDTVTSEGTAARRWERREGRRLQRVLDEGTDEEMSDDSVTTPDPRVNSSANAGEAGGSGADLSDNSTSTDGRIGTEFGRVNQTLSKKMENEGYRKRENRKNRKIGNLEIKLRKVMDDMQEYVGEKAEKELPQLKDEHAALQLELRSLRTDKTNWTLEREKLENEIKGLMENKGENKEKIKALEEKLEAVNENLSETKTKLKKCMMEMKSKEHHIDAKELDKLRKEKDEKREIDLKEKDHEKDTLRKEKDEELSNLRKEREKDLNELRKVKDEELDNLRKVKDEELDNLRKVKDKELDNLRKEKDEEKDKHMKQLLNVQKDHNEENEKSRLKREEIQLRIQEIERRLEVFEKE